MKKYFFILLSIFALQSCSSIDEKDVETGVKFQKEMDDFDKDHADGTLDYDEMNKTIEEKQEWQKEMKEKYTTRDERKELEQGIEDKLKGK